MKNNASGFLWGCILILAGILIAGNIFGIFSFNLFFDGWWTLFIIVPCAASLFQKEFRMSALVGLILGVFLLLAAQDVVSIGNLLRLMVPVILVLIGIKLIFREKFNKNISRVYETSGNSGLSEYNAIFSANKVNFHNETMPSFNTSAVFGGVDINARSAVLADDIVITATAIFGGITMYAPENAKIVVSSIPVFGGVSNKAFNRSDENTKTIFLNATCMFGGIDIK